ncbi:MAG: hypothetical protein HND48_23390 [Chloroflexi bacterium]|nr:hypothetical protein [Chloroflexota bacterium]
MFDMYSKRGVYFNNEVHGMHYGEFANYTEYFAQALLSGGDYSPGLAEGLETFCIMEAVKRSASNRRAGQDRPAAGRDRPVNRRARP